MAFLDRIVPFIARLFLVILFPFSGLSKILDWNLAMQQAASSFMPGAPLLIAGIFIELVMPVLILIRLRDRLAAFILAGFCVATALMFHDFWNYPGLLAPGGGPALDHFWEFWKNLGLAGGLMFIVLDAQTRPFSDFVRRPFSSTGPDAGRAIVR
jgi:putative oxidoreductase